MLVTIVVPEYILGKALADLYAAHISKWEMRKYVKSDGAEWGLSHAFFANMGGFVLSLSPSEMPNSEWQFSGFDAEVLHAAQQDVEQAGAKHTPKIALTKLGDSRLISGDNLESASVGRRKTVGAEDMLVRLPTKSSKRISAEPDHTIRLYRRVHGEQQTLETFRTSLRSDSKEIPTPTASSCYNVPFHLLAREIFALRETGALPKLPKITSAEIADKSKGDTFVKLITSFQVFWFIFQVIVRAVRHLGISQLEIAVTAFSACAVITYLLLLPKPKSVDVPVTLMRFEGRIPLDQDQFKTLRERVLQGYIRALFVLGEDILNEVDVMGSHIPNDALDSGLMQLIILHVGVSIGGVIFGAIHIAAWNLSFPTLIEQKLWRTASIMATTLPPVMYFALLLEQFFLHGYFPVKMIKIWNIVFGSLYVVARAFLLVEIFRTLFYLPEDAYVTTWASNFPHMS
jgi:hypothetical protein